MRNKRTLRALLSAEFGLGDWLLILMVFAKHRGFISVNLKTSPSKLKQQDNKQNYYDIALTYL